MKYISALLLGVIGLIIILVATVAADEEPQQYEEWPQYGYDWENHAYTESPAPTVNITYWEYPMTGVDSSPVVGFVPTLQRYVLFIVDDQGFLFAIDVKGNGDGSTYLHWRTKIANTKNGRYKFATPIYSDGYVYAYGADDGSYLYKIDAATGTLQWSIHIGCSPYFNSPTLRDDVIYTACAPYLQSGGFHGDAVISAWGKDMGESRGQFVDDGQYTGTPVVGTSKVFSSYSPDFYSSGDYYSIRAHSLSAIGTAPSWAEGGVDSHPMVGTEMCYANGVIYHTTKRGNFVARTENSGSKLWHYDMGWLMDAPCTVHDGRVYVGGGYQSAFTVLDTSGNLLWEYDSFEGSIDKVPIISNDMVIFAAQNVYALDLTPEDGVDDGVLDDMIPFLGFDGPTDPDYQDRGYDIIWYDELDGYGIGSSPIVADGKLFVNTRYTLKAYFGFQVDLNVTTDTSRTILERGGNATFNFTVTNGGGIADDYAVSIIGLPPGWNGWVEEDGTEVDVSSLHLGPRSKRDFTLVVDAPEGLLQNESFTLSLRADSLSQPSVGDVEDLDVRLIIVYDVSIDADETVVYADPGSTALVKLTVRNIGNIDDEFRLIADLESTVYSGDNWESLGWRLVRDVKLSQDTHDLEPKEATRTNFTVRIPSVALPGERISFRLIARSTTGGSFIQDVVRVTFVVSELSDLRMTAETTNALVMPDETFVFRGTMENLGNVVEHVELDIEQAGGVTGGWDIVFPPDKERLSGLLVPVGKQVSFVVRVTAPEDGRAGERLIFSVAATTLSDSDPTRLNFTVEVQPSHSLYLIIPDVVSVDAGATHTEEVTVVNTGNANISLRASILTSTPGWQLGLDGSDVLTFSLSPGARKAMDLTILPPFDIWSGCYNITYMVAPSVGTDGPVPMQRTINSCIERHRDVRATLDRDSMSALSGLVDDGTLLLENAGNSPELLRLEGDVFQFGGPYLLMPNSSLRIDYIIAIPQDADEGTLDADLTVFSQEDLIPEDMLDASSGLEVVDDIVSMGDHSVVVATEVAIGSMEVTVEIPDLSLSMSTDGDNAPPGSIIAIRGTVQNNGDVDARNVKVGLLVDSILTEEKTLRVVRARGTGTVVFLYSVLDGDHRIEIQLDPHGDLAADDVLDNVDGVSFKGVESSGGISPIIVGGGAGLLIVMVAGGLMVIRKRGGGSEDDPWAEDDDDDGRDRSSDSDMPDTVSGEASHQEQSVGGVGGPGSGQQPSGVAQRYGYGGAPSGYGQGQQGYGQQQGRQGYGQRPGYGGGQGYPGQRPGGYGGPPGGGYGATPCPKCRTPINPGVKFCPECGHSMAPAGCKSCGTPLNPGVKFCPECGSKT